jgi:hypothetical protein
VKKSHNAMCEKITKGNPVDSNQIPDEWKHLPSLGIPDGAHNYTKGSKQVVKITFVFTHSIMGFFYT